MFCSNCGKSIDDDARFCTNCGHAVQSNVPAPETPPAAPAPQNAAAPTPPPSPSPEQKKPGGHKKNTVLIIVIAVLAALLVAVSVWLAIHLISNSPSDNSDRDSHSEEVISDEDEDEDEDENEDKGKDTGGTSAPSGSESVDRPAPGTTESSGTASGSSEEVTMDTTIRIGVLEPLTGDMAFYGSQEFLGIEYANSLTPTVNIGGIEYQVELVCVDNASDHNEAVFAAQSLVDEKVSVVLGSAGSALSMAASDVFADAGIPVIGISCTNPYITEGNDHYFRVCPLDTFQGIVMANFAQGYLNANDVYCLAQAGNDYDWELIDVFRETFNDDSVVEFSASSTVDFTTYLDMAVTYNADAIFAPGGINASEELIQQAGSMSVSLPILSSDLWDSDSITETARNHGVDFCFPTLYLEGNNPGFDDGFRNFTGNEASIWSALGYDAYYVALETLKNAGSTYPGDVLDALSYTTWDGVTGPIAFDETGDAIRNGAYVKYYSAYDDSWFSIWQPVN